MDQIIFKYPGQIFVGVATRNADATLNHQCFLLLKSVPKKGDALLDGEVAEVLTDEALLKDLANRGLVDKMEAVAVLKAKA